MCIISHPLPYGWISETSHELPTSCCSSTSSLMHSASVHHNQTGKVLAATAFKTRTGNWVELTGWVQKPNSSCAKPQGRGLGNRCVNSPLVWCNAWSIIKSWPRSSSISCRCTSGRKTLIPVSQMSAPSRGRTGRLHNCCPAYARSDEKFICINWSLALLAWSNPSAKCDRVFCKQEHYKATPIGPTYVRLFSTDFF